MVYNVQGLVVVVAAATMWGWAQDISEDVDRNSESEYSERASERRPQT